MKLKIKSDTRKSTGWVKGSTSNGLLFVAKVYDEASEYGIKGGRVSKLELRDRNGVAVYSYDRGLDFEMVEGLEVDRIVSALETLPAVHV